MSMLLIIAYFTESMIESNVLFITQTMHSVCAMKASLVLYVRLVYFILKYSLIKCVCISVYDVKFDLQLGEKSPIVHQLILLDLLERE